MMRRSVLLTAALSVLSFSAGAGVSQASRVDFLKKHAVAVRSVDAADADFADLEPLRRVIGDRRIVMLGEATHGDGATFAAKTRLIKFLHERMGFDVLAFESGLYDVRLAWSALKAGEDPLKAVRTALFEDWADSGQARPLWNYVAGRMKSDRPLELAGFDLQFTGSASWENLVKDLNDFLSRAGFFPQAASLAARVSEPLDRLANNLVLFHEILPEDRGTVRSAIFRLVQTLELAPPPHEPDAAADRAFWIQLLKSSSTLMELSWKLDLASLGKRPPDTEIFNLRDRQMGENLFWLAKKAYPNRKIIVWAANSHIARNRASILNEPDPLVSMGDWVAKEMGSEVYALGFTAGEGNWRTFGMPEPAAIPLPPADSLEDLLVKTGFKFAWLDFRNLPTGGQWLCGPLSARPFGYVSRTADWTRLFDGIFFIREMSPSTRMR